MSTVTFSVGAGARFGPRTGSVTLQRHASPTTLTIPTPGLMVATSRGVVPHLSRDQHKRTHPLRWVHVPFETFLENSPPTPTLQPGALPLHTFLGFSPDSHLVSLTLRDPADPRDVPANGNAYVTAMTARGVKKVTPDQWRTYVRACAPDVVVALPDVPYTPPPFSQKRTTKSIDRTAAWLANLLAPASEPLSILVHMAGGISVAARRAFAESLTETLHGKEADAVRPHTCLDHGVAGYIFDLVPLRRAMDASPDAVHAPAARADETAELFKASLTPVAPAKLRVVNSAASPHEILRLVRTVGVDVFDAKWAQDAAHVGVALDFVFPIQNSRTAGKQRDLGHNLYRAQYAHDLSRFADSNPGCPCGACAPVAPAAAISHSVLDAYAPPAAALLPPYTRAYLHHLLHTHEMTAHALLVMHNLAVVDAFFAGVRGVLHRGEDFGAEVDRFVGEYDEALAVVDEARAMWKDVDVARGKGRMARERIEADAPE
ncbi:tRNA-guanine(15) transglycosylase-like protein [Mycena rosella]|uniref:tRNA-guanine(15) transglycosylase-like protein n=1 Tax=Mycena rosella TaxID=1033263 RepID=A0AAD7D2C7_MYCRO|nr:tRNA-guanine(15) transglycosylase-like protein [Mycena rosella]